MSSTKYDPITEAWARLFLAASRDRMAARVRDAEAANDTPPAVAAPAVASRRRKAG